MTENEPPSLSDAINLALAILEPFRESSLYEDYQAVDGWTDDQFQTALNVLTEAAAQDGLPRQHFFVVDAAESGTGAVRRLRRESTESAGPLHQLTRPQL